MARGSVALCVLALCLSVQSSRIVRFTVEEFVDDQDAQKPPSALASFLSLLRGVHGPEGRPEPAGKVPRTEPLLSGGSPYDVGSGPRPVEAPAGSRYAEGKADDVALPIVELLPAVGDRAYPEEGPVKGFSWDNCGKPSSVLTISQVSLTPDPIPNPGTVTLVLRASLSQQVNAPLEADVVLEKKVAFVWVKVPCEGGRGSCNYADVCSMVPQGTCPIKAGPQSLTQSFSVPSLPSGDYRVTVDMKYKGAWLACVHATLTLA